MKCVDMLRYLKLMIKNNKPMSFGIDDQKLLQKYKVAWAKTEDLKNIILNILLVYDDRYIKPK